MPERVLAVIGPPGAGKTTLTLRLARLPGCWVFRLREHVPETILAATASSAEQLGWIDDLTVTRSLSEYMESAAAEPTVSTILMDNFPGSGTQVCLLLSLARKWLPHHVVHVVELLADPVTLNRRVCARRVCHSCERDPIRDPRLPALASAADPRRCAHCNGILHPRRGDAPRLFSARMRRYEQAAKGIRDAFLSAGVEILQLNASRPPEQLAAEMSLLLATRRTPL